MTALENNLLHQLKAVGVRRCRMIVGISGGPDSVALLHGLLAVREELSLELIAGHVDHELRGASADDAEWVAARCAAWGVPVETRSARVAQIARQTGSGIEETARRIRYAFLAEIALARSCPIVSVGHTRDDQVETILHHLLRGTGLGGLRGMPVDRVLESGVRLIRPLLTTSRDEVLSYLHENGQAFRDDSSNSDPAFTRNRIRGTLLPLLREEFNPRVDEALSRLAAQAAEWQDIIGGLAEALLEQVLLDVQRDHVRISCGPLTTSQRPLLREALKQLWEQQGWPRGEMTFRHWDQLADMALDAAGGGSVQMPGGLAAHRRGALLVVARHAGPEVASARDAGPS